MIFLGHKAQKQPDWPILYWPAHNRRGDFSYNHINRCGDAFAAPLLDYGHISHRPYIRNRRSQVYRWWTAGRIYLYNSWHFYLLQRRPPQEYCLRPAPQGNCLRPAPQGNCLRPAPHALRPVAAHINMSYHQSDEYVWSVQNLPIKLAPVYTIARPNLSKFYQSRYTRPSHLSICSPAETAWHPLRDIVISSGLSLHRHLWFQAVSQYNNYRRIKASQHSAQNSSLFARTSV